MKKDEQKLLVVVLIASLLSFTTGASAQDADETEEVTVTVTVKKKKKGGARGTAAAGQKQRAGGNLQTSAGSRVAETYLGVTCDASVEGLAWCDSEVDVAFCSGGTWWSLDCSAVDEAAFCGYDIDSDVIDCFVDY